MLITPTNNVTSNISSSAAANTKKARLISKGLDRPRKNTSVRTKEGRRGLKTSQRKSGAVSSRRNFKKKFKRGGPSNYEANIRTTHDFSTKLKAERLTLRSLRNKQNLEFSRRLPNKVSTLTIEPATYVLRRAVTAQYQPNTVSDSVSERAQRNYQLRLNASYRPFRHLLASTSRLRVRNKAILYLAKGARTPYWTAKKRRVLLHRPDARKLGRRSRRRSKPRVGLTAERARLTRQLVRKYRASRGSRHTAVRRRLIRFRWFNRKYLKKLKYPRRRRMLRRAIRRASRYLRATIAVLTSAGQRHILSRECSRMQRLLLRRTETATTRLLIAASKELTHRQQVLNYQQQNQKSFANTFLSAKTRFLHSLYRTKSSRTWAQSSRAAMRLQRTLSARHAVYPPSFRAPYRFSRLLQRQTISRPSRWLELKNSRVQKKTLFDKKYLTAPFIKLQQFILNRRIRRITSQRQQTNVCTPVTTPQLYPETVSARYTELRRRLQFKLRNTTTQAALFSPVATEANRLPEVAAFARSGNATLWRRAETPNTLPRFQLPGFLRNSALRSRATALSDRARTAVGANNAVSAYRTASLMLRAQRASMLEKRFYRQRTPLRLPRTIVKRTEIRRSGARLFARNTLKNPETWSGKRKLLLPAAKSYFLATRNASCSSPLTQTDLRPIRRLSSEYPRVWARGPGYHESALVYDIRDKKRSAAVRANLRALKLRAKKVSAPDNTNVLLVANKLDQLVRVASTPAITSGTYPTVATKLTLLRERVSRAVRYNLRRSTGQANASAAGATTGRTILRQAKAPSRVKKQRALWHLRSVKNMLIAERQLSAWSPQYPTRWRRWSSPRFAGSPIARRWPSRKLLRQRAMINAALVYRGRPKRKHFDRAYSHLQFHRGSAATVGYDRFRRVHRTRSKNNRWWKPVPLPSPFGNPYSRRSINAKKHITKRLARQHTAHLGEVGTRTRGIKGAWFPIAQPPRVISSRNFKIKQRRFEPTKAFKLREKAERAKLPATLQRWTVRAEKYRFGSTASPRKVVVLTRNKRATRRLEGLYPRASVWTGYNWQNFDSAQKSTSAANLFSAVCRKLPATFWSTLQQKYSAPTAALAAKKEIFSRFSTWYNHLPTQYTSERSLLLGAMRCVITGVNGLASGHHLLEASQYTQAVAQKKDRFWRLRELPRLRRGLTKEGSILNKNNGTLYKRWLCGAERYLKRSRTSYLPPKHSRGGSGQIRNFGRNRRRFPASGRRRHSYDSMLHAFARRTAPTRFRKITNLRFKRPTVKVDTAFKVNVKVYELSQAMRRQRKLARKLGRVAYLTPSWRELLSYRANSPVSVPSTDFTASVLQNSLKAVDSVTYPTEYAQPFSSTAKRRFASLPLSFLFKRALASRKLQRAKRALTLRTQRSGLLRTALRRRRQERIFVDLKKHLSRRKLPKEELSAPWRRKKSVRRREQHLRYGDWSPRHFQFRQSKAVFWAMHDLEERVPRRRDRTRIILTKTPSSEFLTLPSVATKKFAWTKKGFQIKLPVLKAHRRVRREKKRRRRGRSGITKERRARFHHTSERRNFALIKKISGRSNKNLLVKVSSIGRKLHSSTKALTKNRNPRAVAALQNHWQRPAQRASLVSLQRFPAYAVKKLSASGQLCPDTLLSFSAENHKKKLLHLSFRTDGSRNKFMKRAFTALRRAVKHKTVSTVSISSSRVEAASALRRFTANATIYTPTAPLSFQKPTKLIVKSDAEKKRAVVWNIQSKERRYKHTAQYAEALTTYIPQLISFMLSQRIKNNPLPYASAKTLINATYWNLRVYLNVDPFERRLALRDNNFSLLRTLARDMAVLAKDQVTEHADRTRLRERFQTSRVHPAPTSDRFRLDWLRAFFPRKHALFQEDPEEYASIPVSTRNIRRLIPSGYGINRWRTAPASVSLERRSRRLLRLRLSKCTPRFETLLQSARRVPQAEVDSLLPEVNFEALAAQRATQKSTLKKRTTLFESATSGFLFNSSTPALLGLSSYRGSFFSRQFTTQTSRTAGAVSRFIIRRSRLLTSAQNATSAFVAVSSRYQLKSRAAARGRSSFTAHARWTIDTGSLDPRFLRYKSPRSRQYLIRLPSAIVRHSDEDKLTKLLALRELRDNRDSAASKKSILERRILRTSRRYFYNDQQPFDHKSTLSTYRTTTATRRRPAFLRARGSRATQGLSNAKLYNFPNRQQLTFVSAGAHVGTLQRTPHSIIRGSRSILQHRMAEKRSIAHTYRADTILRKLPFTLGFAAKRAGRAGKKAFALLAKLEEKRDAYLHLLRFAPQSKKVRYQALFTRVQRALRRAQSRLTTIRSTRMYSPAVPRSIKRPATFLRSSTPYRFTSNAAGQRAEALVNSNAVKATSSFQGESFGYLATQRRFTKKCMRLQALRRRMIFDTSRPRLWHKLTNRWMKKERLMRNWLKGVKRWFRDPWLSQSVDITRPDTRRLLPGEIRAREQQVGEVVEGDENDGLTQEEDAALQKAALPAIEAAKKAVNADIHRAYKLSRRAGALQKKVIRVRRAASQEALRTPRPSMWLADLQAKQKTAETAIWRTKTRKEKDEIRLAAKEAAIARTKAGLPPLARKKDPLKMPADHWMPSIVWKDIQRRARRLEWRESDDVFARKGFRNAFRFYPSERNRAPWLESLMYNRSLFSTRLREFRRRQFPKEQKKYKWLQRVRKSLFPGRTHTYIKGRRWPRLRMYNQRLHYTLFNLPNRSAARRHFKKLNRRSRKVGFVHSQEGLSNRLDNVLIHLNMAPTIFWARTIAPHGLLRVNGTIVTRADYLFKAGDFIEPLWAKVLRFRHFFECPPPRNDEVKRHKRFSVGGIPKNLLFHRGIRCFTFLGNPHESDLRRSSRLQPHLFRWFRLDSV